MPRRELIMKRYIILLRGINVSGKNKIPMADLRALLGTLEFINVKTYIQSGNIILDSDLDQNTICQKIKAGIASKFGFEVPVVLRTIDAWEKAFKNYPFSLENEKINAFTFLDQVVESISFEVKGIKEDVYLIDEDVIYLQCPSTFADTKLTNNLFEKKLNVTATSRNYRTTMKLLDLAKA